MSRCLGTVLLLAFALYLPFLVIVGVSSAPWWGFLGAPGWPVQLVLGNNLAAMIVAAVLTFLIVAVLTWYASEDRKRLLVFGVSLLAYAVVSALILNSMIQAG